MMSTAFSTLACPDWTLTQVAERASRLGFESVELRTFGDGSRSFACDPALSSETKVRAMFREAGVQIAALATGLRFDAQVFPPVLGYLNPEHDRSAREGKRAVGLAVALECPLVRVFGFEYPQRERKASALKRIGARIQAVADHADKSGVRVVLENGGSFTSGAALRELIQAVGHPLVGACYSLAAGAMSGHPHEEAIALLGDRLWLARVKDADGAGRPVPLGRGVLGPESFVRSLGRAGFAGPIVYEWDRAWMPDLDTPDSVLPRAAETLARWVAPERASATTTPAGGGGLRPSSPSAR